MPAPIVSPSDYYSNQPGMAGLLSRISMSARRKMFARFMDIAQPKATTSILDVGVTSDRRQESNFFEKLYPFSQQITAVGLEDAAFLEKDHPGLTYVRADGMNLPFPDKSFDLVVSFAVIEHVGSRAKQRAFINELSRVGKSVYLTTPNRWFPVEFHTVVPVLHWLPPNFFRAILRLLGKTFYAQEANLNLLSAEDLKSLLPADCVYRTAHNRLLGITSNLCFLYHVKD